MRRTTVLLSTGLAALAAAVPAIAASDHYVARTVAQPASTGLAVTGALSGYRAVASARVVTLTTWRTRSAPAGRLRFAVTSNPSCHYDVTFRVASQLSDDKDAVARVTAALPAAGARYVLDGGQRGSTAFRVVRQKTTGARVRVDARWTGVLTRRADVTGGRTDWADIVVSAVSRSGDECHSGTWRQVLGPRIGDALATAKATLRIVKP